MAIPPLHLFSLGRLPFHDARVASGVKMPQWHTKDAGLIKPTTLVTLIMQGMGGGVGRAVVMEGQTRGGGD